MRPEHTCPECGIVFSDKPSKRRVYCSRHCGVAATNRRPLAERLWEKVEKGRGCWTWRGSLGGSGYGSIHREGRQIAAHRAAWEVTYGPVPKGLHVCHRCDNRRCVRPDHLFLGSRSDNMQDALAKGRFAAGARHPSRVRPGYLPRGEDHPNARLSAETVREIRRRYAAGQGYDRIAKALGIGRSSVGRVVKRESWDWVK